MMFLRRFPFLYKLLTFFTCNELRGFHHINLIILRPADPDFGLHQTMHRTFGNAVIMLPVWCKPSDFFSQILMTEITFRADDLMICQSLLLIFKLPGNILHIIRKKHMDLFFMGFWKNN